MRITDMITQDEFDQLLPTTSVGNEYGATNENSNFDLRV